jgi:hypothetical protein
MTVALKALAIALAALAMMAWLDSPDDGRNAVATKQVAASAPRCMNDPSSRCMIDIRYAVQAPGFMAVPEDIF